MEPSVVRSRFRRRVDLKPNSIEDPPYGSLVVDLAGPEGLDSKPNPLKIPCMGPSARSCGGELVGGGGNSKQQSSRSIREMLKAWETVASCIEKHHPNKAVAVRASNLFYDNAVSHFGQLLKRRQKQMSLDSFLLKKISKLVGHSYATPAYLDVTPTWWHHEYVDEKPPDKFTVSSLRQPVFTQAMNASSICAKSGLETNVRHAPSAVRRYGNKAWILAVGRN
ncbi:hypothetical protein AVEN_175137-1 [Araneus ventricosus]|uniref:Uncharacterized protein n=1 Tax=Araneus ventricosus TaxID=182803 RepID=A0A4Y2N274_ARAVE|nr:hypothetical protein AVEN_175137-1 [Araneus ventricosus]